MSTAWHGTSWALVLAATCGPVLAQITERTSMGTGGSQPDHGSGTAAITDDGRFVAFHALASNLVPGDVNGTGDVFVHDRQAGTTELVSRSTNGALGNLVSSHPSLSGNGRFVSFGSSATTLVAGDTNSCRDIFVRDRQEGTTERVSVDTLELQADRQCGFYSVISSDGRYVAFSCEATNLDLGDTNDRADIFVRDRTNGTTERVSVSTNLDQANYGVRPEVSMSADGRFVAFESMSTSLVPSDFNARIDVFLRDRLTQTTELLSLNSAGAQGNGDSRDPSVSDDGRFLAFVNYGTNMDAGDTNGYPDVYVRDRVAGTTQRASSSSSGVPGTLRSVLPRISADGRFVAFESDSPEFVPGDTNGQWDVFRHDRVTGSTERVSVSTAGAQSNHRSSYPALSGDGRLVAFESAGTNLVTGDTNGFTDVFVRDYGVPTPVFCFGDGTGAACPCGNGASGNGCPSSVSTNGATLIPLGIPSLAWDTFQLSGTDMPNSSALYIQGTTRVASGAGIVFGDGLRCIGGSIIRLGTQSNSSGASQYPQAGDPSISARGLVTVPGIRTYQVWYRNAAAFCTPATFNLTNGVEATWTL